MKLPGLSSFLAARRRLRLRFRLRTVFVLITLLCVWLGVSMQRKFREVNAMRVIASAGGSFTSEFSWFYPFRSVDVVAFSGQDFTDAKLAEVAEALAALPSLEYLQVVNTSVSDAGLAHLRALHRVRRLELWGTAVTDEGVEHLLSLRQLRHLDLSATLVSDICLGRLAELNRLEMLMLPPSAGFSSPRPPHVLVSETLERQLLGSWSAPGTVSKSAVQELKRRLPGCTIRQTKAYVSPQRNSILPNPIPYELR